MAIANDGIAMKPYMIDRIENTDGKIIKSFDSEEADRLMNKKEAEFLRELMTSVVEEGTGTRLQSDKYQAAGKTGSAEYNNRGDSHAWFTGFAPADDPEIALTIIVEAGGTGGEKAVPLAKLIFDEYFK